MSIHNRTTLEAFWLVDGFLRSFREAGDLMKHAADDLERIYCSLQPADVKRYKAVHHKLVRLRRAWNAVEHEREAGAKGQVDKPPASPITFTYDTEPFPRFRYTMNGQTDQSW